MSGSGWFAVDRAQMRSAMEELGGGATFGLFLVLAADCRDGCMANGNVKDLAVDYGFSQRAMRAMLTDLDERGWIEWRRPQNQNDDGSIRIVRDLENVKRPKQPAVSPNWRDEPTESGAPPLAEVRGATGPADVPPTRRPDAASIAADAPPPAEVRGATRGNAVHQEPRTKNQEPEPNAVVQPSAEPIGCPSRLIESSPDRESIVMALEEGDDERFVETFSRRVPEAKSYWKRIAVQHLRGTAIDEGQRHKVAGLLAFGWLANLDRQRTERDVRQLVEDAITAKYETWLVAVFDALGLDVSGNDGWEARRDVYMPMTRPIAWDIEHARQWRDASGQTPLRHLHAVT